MLLRRTDIGKILCGKCGKNSEIVLRKGEISGSVDIIVHPCTCNVEEEKIIPLMFIDDIEKQYTNFLGTAQNGQNLYSEWQPYD